MTESLQSKLYRYWFNFYPTYRSTGAWLTYISEDWSEVRLKLPLGWRTRNYVGTMFGGSMYSCIDPIYMMMLIMILGPDYIVWDKAATIRFKKPGRETLFVKFSLSEEEIGEIKSLADKQDSVDREYLVQLVNKAGEVHAEIQKTLYIKKKYTARE